MFYLTSLVKDIGIHPKDTKDKDIRVIISSKIRELEGKIMGKYGYIISIIEFNKTSKGKIDNETGIINFKVVYRAITFKLSENEILYSKPVFINEHGFFCEVGPSVIFVSQHMIPLWKYNTEENCWIIKTGKDVIKVGKDVCIRILASKINSNDINLLAELA